MTGFDLKLEGDGAWEDLKEDRERIIHIPNALIGLACLEGGMTSGKPSLAFRIDLPNGKVVIAETSWNAWRAANAALSARLGEVDEFIS